MHVRTRPRERPHTHLHISNHAYILNIYRLDNTVMIPIIANLNELL
jgi:hypothetical protein